jgi:valyl-tRNA synthetase
MDKTYQPQAVEEKWYRFWEEGGYFKPQIDPSKKPFVITLPPPNVTGGLHAGHALYTVEDILARYHRMKGDPTLFLPGFDHASISVEYLVRKQLREEGKTKKEVGREEFLRRAEKFANESRNYIREQLKKLGYSLDWSREAYTMDETRSRAVQGAFNRLREKGLIYQGERIISWCPRCETVLSDLEVEHEERKTKLWFIKYNLKSQVSKLPFITVATTRPETMLGDTAVAVHPNDKRYKNLVGQKVILPLMNREIPIIADEVVDPKFGTGAVKVTPAHDPADFEIGQRHNLEMIPVIGFDGKMTKAAGSYYDETVSIARGRVLEDLRKIDALEKEEDYTHSVSVCERCGTLVEPLVSKQWFVSTSSKFKVQSSKLRKLLGTDEASLAEAAIEAVRRGHIKIIPERFEKVYFHWLEHIRDWCISRQLWWGHQIPIEGEDDVLDTWFSSGLWPISTLGWPEETESFKYFYPTTVRETGYDILFFWVAREIMMCLAMTGEVPFKVVYLHGLVRDEKGRKFSKTKGIGFDPLDIMGKYGTDALRMGLIVGNPPGSDMKIGEDKFVAYRNFSNKLWNIGRFIIGRLEGSGCKKYEDLPSYANSLEGLTEEDRDIVGDLQQLVRETTNLIERYRFDLAAEGLYHFVWHRFADEYIEYSKKRIEDGDRVVLTVLRYVYLNCLKLLHPFIPFITEELWHALPRKYGNPLIVSSWPRLS